MSQQFIEPEQLALLLRGPEKDQVQVVDVRGEDFEGGHIKGAINIESGLFKEASSVDAVLDSRLLPKPATKVVVHCMHSKQRGPACAAALAQRLQERDVAGAPEVLVLRGGFAQFVAKYQNQPDLVEGVEAAGADKA